VDRLPQLSNDRTKGTEPEELSPTVKELEHEEPSTQQNKVEEEGDKRVFNPAGYEEQLVDTIKKDILQCNPDVAWSKVAGLQEAKAILVEAVMLPILRPDYFKVAIFLFPVTRSCWPLHHA
jgi:katanin p60 ATPase-containing subunit A1